MPRERWGDDDVSWRQLYRANKTQLWEKMPQYVKKDPAGTVDEKASETAFQNAPLVRGIVLEFLDRRPPETWPGLVPPPLLLDHPVMSVSYDDVEAFAEWAGKHVPTEQEWEYAARGPEGFFYPWGDDWFDDVKHANWAGGYTIGMLLGNDSPEPITMPVETLAGGALLVRRPPPDRERGRDGPPPGSRPTPGTTSPTTTWASSSR